MQKVISFIAVFLSFMYAAQAQSLESVSPNSGAKGSTLPITITGNRTNFTNTTQFVFSQGTNLLQVSDVVAVSPTSATANITIPPTAASGAYNLLALSGIGLPLQLSGAFTVTADGGSGATISNVSPSEGQAGQILILNITGVGTQFTQSSPTAAVLVQPGSGSPIVSSVAVPISPTTLFATFNVPASANPGMYNLRVNTSNQGVLIKQDAVFINGGQSGGELVSISPSSSDQGKTVNVTITGRDTRFTSLRDLEGWIESDNGFYEITDIVTINNTTVTGKITLPTSARLGVYSVYVGANEEFYSLQDGFAITGDPSKEPRLVTISPNIASPGQTVNVTVKGAFTTFTDSLDLEMAIYNDDMFVEPTQFSIVHDSELVARFEIPDSFIVGSYNFGFISNTDGFLELPDAFIIAATGINEITQSVRVYPNPAKDKLYLDINEKPNHIELTDITGKTIRIDAADIKYNIPSVSIDLSKYSVSKGLYFINIQTDKVRYYQKVMVE
jgi:hypothetical protein